MTIPITLVGSASNFNAVGPPTTLSATIGQSTNGGCLFVACGGNRSSTVTITDPRGNSVTNDVNTASGGNTQFSIHRIPIVTNYQTSDSFTATWSVGSPDRFIALLYAPTLSSTSLNNSTQASGASNVWATGAVTTSVPYAIAITGCVDNASAQLTNTPTSPWIELLDTNTTDSVNFVVQYVVLSTTQSINGQGTWGVSTSLTRMGLAVYAAIPSTVFTRNTLRPAIFKPGTAR